MVVVVVVETLLDAVVVFTGGGLLGIGLGVGLEGSGCFRLCGV